MIWYIRDTARFQAEREGISTLERGSKWLAVSAMRFDTSGRLCVDAEISTENRIFPITLRYGHNFPFSPPSVVPQKPQRWSSHQYGGDELCLEYGPDNWHPSLTGADLLASTERLLAAETPSGSEPRVEVPSRHATTMGQDMRHVYFRLLVTTNLLEVLRRAPRGSVGSAKFVALLRDDSFVAVPSCIHDLLGEPWMNPDIPEALSKNSDWSGLIYILPTGVLVPTFERTTEFDSFVVAQGLKGSENGPPVGTDLRLVFDDAGAHLLWPSRTEDKVYHAGVINSDGGRRLSSAHAGLASKKVGIVGCGSVGSKTAVMLARAGVRQYVLLDDDLFLPDNLVRHDLDWSGMGEHKTDALARRIGLAAPGSTCTLRRHRLGGQEANGGLDGALNLLKGCDLLVDATADSHVFNLISAVAHADSKPVFWAEVFAGGLGGLIARSRPGLDPSPQVVRGRVLGWCSEQGISPPRYDADYAAQGETGLLVADDADVTVIAAHLARFVIDALLERTPSFFPVSAYIIGLSPGWIFEQPFETFPIDVGSAMASAEGAGQPDPLVMQTILEMYESRRDLPSDAT